MTHSYILRNILLAFRFKRQIDTENKIIKREMILSPSFFPKTKTKKKQYIPHIFGAKLCIWMRNFSETPILFC